MLMVLTMWVLGKMGVAPTADDFVRYDRDFRLRGHHLTLDFGAQRRGLSRFRDDPDFQKLPVMGAGYEYLVDRPYHAVGIELLAQSQGTLAKRGARDNFVVVTGALAYYPKRNVRLFLAGGPQVALQNGRTVAVGRAGIGYRFMFFKLGMQPYAYAEAASNGQGGWGLMFRFEY